MVWEFGRAMNTDVKGLPLDGGQSDSARQIGFGAMEIGEPVKSPSNNGAENSGKVSGW